MVLHHVHQDPVTAGEPIIDMAALPAPPAWTEDALCAETGYDLFFPEAGLTKAARQICGMCPVTEACLEYALSFEHSAHAIFGIWGGKSAKQRARILRQRQQDGAA